MQKKKATKRATKKKAAAAKPKARAVKSTKAKVARKPKQRQKPKPVPVEADPVVIPDPQVFTDPVPEPRDEDRPRCPVCQRLLRVVGNEAWCGARRHQFTVGKDGEFVRGVS